MKTIVFDKINFIFTIPSLLALALLILTGCNQLDIEPNRTTHEDLVKDNTIDNKIIQRFLTK